MDAGKHFIGGVVTTEFLEFSKQRGRSIVGVMDVQPLMNGGDVGNDLMTRRNGFPGLKDGCRWCLCVDRCACLEFKRRYPLKMHLFRWKEALVASERLGEKVVPRSVSHFSHLILLHLINAFPRCRVDLSSTAFDATKTVKMEDLQRFQWITPSNT